MAYRSTKEKAAAQAKARKLYVAYGMSLDEIHEETGEPIKTLRSWSNLGDWKGMREEILESELDRLVRLRDHLLDKAEAQIREDKLPHTELGLVCKLERLIFQREKKEERINAIMMNTLQYLSLYLMEHDPELGRAFVHNHLKEFTRWIFEQDLIRPPEEVSRSVQELIRRQQELAQSRQGSTRPPQGFARQRHEFNRQPQEPIRQPQGPIRARKSLTRARKNLARMQKNLPRMRENLPRMRENLPRPMK